MVLKVFTVYDSKGEVYSRPFLSASKGEAIRAFTTAVNDPSTEFHRYPGDFTLFEIGEFDDSSGTYTMLSAKICLGLALEFKDKQQEVTRVLSRPNTIEQPMEVQQ